MIIPNSWNFFLSFQNSGIENKKDFFEFYFEAKISEYVNFFMEVQILCCIVYTIIFFLGLYIQKVKPSIKKSRKFFYLLFFLLSAILSPPDIVSQIILGSLFCFFFEVYIFYITVKKNYYIKNAHIPAGNQLNEIKTEEVNNK